MSFAVVVAWPSLYTFKNILHRNQVSLTSPGVTGNRVMRLTLLKLILRIPGICSMGGDHKFGRWYFACQHISDQFIRIRLIDEKPGGSKKLTRSAKNSEISRGFPRKSQVQSIEKQCVVLWVSDRRSVCSISSWNYFNLEIIAMAYSKLPVPSWNLTAFENMKIDRLIMLTFQIRYPLILLESKVQILSKVSNLIVSN